jgi:uncharacterized protein
MEDRQFRHRRRVPALLLVTLSVALVVAAPRSGRAEDTSDLYKATTIVTGTDMRSRPAGFARCLREVLVKVSGEPRLRGDPRTSGLAAHADAFVASFDYVDQMAGIKVHDDQGTYDRSYNLTVRFDPARIDKALSDLGERPRLGERPVVVPVLAVRGVSASYLLSAENPAGAEQRASFANAAGEYGMKLRIPTEVELAAWGVTMGPLPSPQAESSPDQVIVAGTLEFREALPGWVGSWRMRWHGVDYAWGISGVNFDEAFRSVVRGALRVASGHDAPD